MPPRRIINFGRNTSLPTDNVKTSNVLETQRQIQFNIDLRNQLKKYLKKYPWAKGWTLEGFILFEKNAMPVSVNGVVRTPTTYKPKVVTIASDTKTKELHKLGLKRALLKLEESKQLKEAEQAAEIVNNPYNPIGWIPRIKNYI